MVNLRVINDLNSTRTRVNIPTTKRKEKTEVLIMAHGYRVIVKFNDGCADAVMEYANEKVADSVVKMYRSPDLVDENGKKYVASVVKEEF